MIFMILVSPENVKKCALAVVARLPQRLKSTFFEIFQKPLILAFEANSALSLKNETKIVKITHSDAEAAVSSKLQ